MSRKRPSAHSDDQFALFLERIKASRDPDQERKFDIAVSKLIRRKGYAPERPPEPPDQAAVPMPQASNGRMTGSSLPPKPDFEAIEAAARNTAEDHSSLEALIGSLVFGWSNNESLLIYVLMLLLETDERSAAVVFATLNTTRARIDLVRRLALLKVGDATTRNELDRVIERFNEASRIRNEVLHAMYSVDEHGKITHTQTMRFVEKRGRVSFGERQAIDRKWIEHLIEARNDLRRLNRELWDMLPRLKNSVAATNQVRSGVGAT